jgi:hypothetical protein
MGSAMGLNTGLANSNFTMMFKVLTGIVAEPLITQTQVAAIQALNCNVYVNSANVYNWLANGILPSGQFFDEVLNLDMLASDLQYSMVNALISFPSIPRTNAGEAVLLGVANQVCERSLQRGFIAPETWTGQVVLGLAPGNPLPKGYPCQAAPFSTQSSGDRQAAKRCRFTWR